MYNYTPKQRMSYEPCDCDAKPNMALIMKIADEQAEQKLTGGFRRFNRDGSSNICTSCFTAKSANGSCNC